MALEEDSEDQSILECKRRAQLCVGAEEELRWSVGEVGAQEWLVLEEAAGVRWSPVASSPGKDSGDPQILGSSRVRNAHQSTPVCKRTAQWWVAAEAEPG